MSFDEREKNSDVVDIVIDDDDMPETGAKEETKPVTEEKPAEAEKAEAEVKSVEAEKAEAETKPETEEQSAEAEKAETETAPVAEEKSAEPETKSAETEKEETETAPAAEEKSAEPETKSAEPDHVAGHDVFVDKKAFVQAEKRHRMLKVLTITLASIFVLGYTAMVILSYMYFQPNTVINGVDYSFRSEAAVMTEIDNKKADYALHISLRNGECTIRPQDIGLVITTEKDVKSIKEEQNPFLWFTAYFRDPNVAAYSVTYDEEKLESYLKKNTHFRTDSMSVPENPKVVMDNGKPEIRGGSPGTYIDMDAFREVLKEKLLTLEPELDVDAEGCYIKARYTPESPEVINFRAQVESYTSLNLTYLFADIKITLTPEQIYNMLELDQDNLTCSVSRRKVINFMADFAWEHNTFGRQREFKTWDGKLVRVTNDYMGWEVDQETEQSGLYDALFHKVSFERAPALLHEGTVYTADNSDIGNSYVEIDLSNQKVVFVMEGKRILFDDIISGNPNRGAQTPGGLYAIYGMRQNVVLTGPGYASHVDYWMPFNGEIGLHDAYWQSKFGGELYKSRGSHGCVNLPYNTAQKIYELGYRGLPVVCYWRTPEYLVGR